MARRDDALVEVRPIERSEALDYLAVLPFANGLPMWEPAPAAWHGGWGASPRPRPLAMSERERIADELFADDDFHSQAAFVDGLLAGASATLSLEINVPGEASVPLAGVTGTAVIATHRRRGLLRKMMQAMFDEALGRGQFLAALSSSEGGIYGRFGFGPATFRARWEMERAEAAFASPVPPSGTLELVDAASARAAWPQLHERIRSTRVGEITAPNGLWDGLSDDADGEAGPVRYAVHRDGDRKIDGIAHYRLPWSPRVEEAGTLVVERLEATSRAAYRSLWELLLDFDLTRRIVAAGRPTDEPLRWMLRNPRAMRITRLSDNLWLRLLDVPAALRARVYNEETTLALRIASDAMCPHNVGTWQLTTNVRGATCEPTDAHPSLVIDIRALGMLYLGGGSASLLAAAGLIDELQPGALATLSRLLRSDPAPFNALGF